MAFPRHTLFIAAPLALIALTLALLAGFSGWTARAELATQAIVRTGVLHEISDFTTQYVNGGAGQAPILSRQGNKLAYGLYVGSSNTNEIYVLNPDGTGQIKAGSLVGNCGCGAFIDLSDDGTKVAATESMQVYLYNADGSGGTRLLNVTSNVILNLRLSADGGKLFFMPSLDTATVGSGTTDVPKGVWVMNADGSGRRQIVSAAQVATAIGTTPDKVFAFKADGPALDVSTDGSRIAFLVQVASATAFSGYDYRLLGVNADGSGLHSIYGGADKYYNLVSTSISGDGSKVSYQSVPGVAASGFAAAPDEVGVIDFDGANRRVLVTQSNATPLPHFAGMCRNQLSRDGSLLVVGCTGYLFRTDGSGGFDPFARTPTRAGTGDQVLTLNTADSINWVTMNYTGTRLLFPAHARTFGGPRQLAVLDLNPVSFGAAPTLANPAVSPSTVLTESRSSAAISATVSSVLTRTRVAAAVLRDGFSDTCAWSYSQLQDNGTSGDPVAGDGNYVYNDLKITFCQPPDTGLGARTLHVKAEGAETATGRRHASFAVIDGLAVVTGTPATATPTATTGSGGTATPTRTATPTATTGAGTATPTRTPGTATPTGTAIAGTWVLDPTYGTGGLVTTTVGAGNDQLSAATLQPDDKVIAVGRTEKSAGANAHVWAVLRYNTNGTLDGSFGTGGKVTTQISAADDGARAVGVQSDGKIVVAGYCEGRGSGYDWCLVRYTATGTVDTTFGTNGTVRTAWSAGGSGAYSSFPTDLVIQSDGKIVVVGHTYVAPGNSETIVAVARYNADGSLDSAFGTGGKVTYNNPSGGEAAMGVALQADGRIVAAGSISVGTVGQVQILRLTAAGALDSTFGSGGVVVQQFGTASGANDVQVQTDGKIVIAGAAGTTSGNDFLIARFTTAGALDTSFGSSGSVLTDFLGMDTATGLAIQPDGRIVAGGNSLGLGISVFALARYTGAGALDTSFTSDGKITTSFGPGQADYAFSTGIQSDGKIVLAGSSYNGVNEDFAVARYAPGGSHRAFLPAIVRTHQASGVGW